MMQQETNTSYILSFISDPDHLNLRFGRQLFLASTIHLDKDSISGHLPPRRCSAIIIYTLYCQNSMLF